jgi:acyl transferase domain-containing protein
MTDVAAPAGTPLGDPIEVGAAAAALDGATREQPLTLLSSKSWLGHAEPAAGVLGIAHAMLALAQQAALPLLHLRRPNPFVASALVGAPGAWSLPRQPGGGVAALAGVSAFPFQGTNAHALLEGPGGSGSLPSASPAAGAAAPLLPWRKQRLWLQPAANLLVRRFSAAAAAGDLVFEARLGAPQLAYLWEHQVAGRAIFPAAGYLELALASLYTALGDQATGAPLAGITGATIPAPLVLPGAGELAGVPLLACHVGRASGAVAIRSAARGRRSAVHFAARVALLAEGEAAESDRQALLALELLAAAGAAAPAAAAQAVGLLQQPASTSGSFLHPASLDCCLQLGAVPLAGAAAAPLRVPAGIELVLLPGSGGGAPEARLAAAVATLRDPSQARAASVQIDYRCFSEGGAPALLVQGLLAKAPSSGAGAAAAAAGAAAAAAAAPAEPDILYGVEYAASCPAVTGSSSSSSSSSRSSRSRRRTACAGSACWRPGVWRPSQPRWQPAR